MRTAFVIVSLIAMSALARVAHAQDPAPEMPHHDHATMVAASLYDTRDASGTSWAPAESPMHGVSMKVRGWELMLHGQAFLQFLHEPGYTHRTGGFSTHQTSSVNWGMLMVRRKVGSGRFGIQTMFSAEPWTVRNCGFINRLASGEICDGDTIHDRQHPHDLIMELSADYERPVGDDYRWQIYGGVAGEPALGPSAFPHRQSAALNPVAPISHHWLDSSHITYGVVTAALSSRRVKAEFSVFNGREPDERRTDLDFGPLDSVSGRVTFAPSRRWSMQVSAGRLNEHEQEVLTGERSDATRFTTSATYHRPLANEGLWATTVAYGANAGRELEPEHDIRKTTHAVLAETALTLRDRHTLYSRLELVGKAAHDLHVHEFPEDTFGVAKLQLGYVRELLPRSSVVAGIGATMSLSVVPKALAPRYDGRVAPGFGVYLTLRPARHSM